jgi:putative Mg2+ transporter-C (MgtC) family protein
MFPDDLNLWTIGTRLVVALLLGATLGWDREARNRPAGIRTHAMVCLGAAMFTILSVQILGGISSESPGVTADAMRLVSGLISGVGFLGAGSIIQSRGSVRGLTTAASIWLIAAVGLACGMGNYRVALLGLALAYVVLAPMRYLEHYLSRREDDSEPKPDESDQTRKPPL